MWMLAMICIALPLLGERPRVRADLLSSTTMKRRAIISVGATLRGTLFAGARGGVSVRTPSTSSQINDVYIALHRDAGRLSFLE
jgi:hypothetical protein